MNSSLNYQEPTYEALTVEAFSGGIRVTGMFWCRRFGADAFLVQGHYGAKTFLLWFLAFMVEELGLLRMELSHHPHDIASKPVERLDSEQSLRRLSLHGELKKIERDVYH